MRNAQASIWRNRGENGDFFNATLEISYQRDGEWKTGRGYGPIESLAVHKAADMAATYTIEQRMEKVRSR